MYFRQLKNGGRHHLTIAYWDDIIEYSQSGSSLYGKDGWDWEYNYNKNSFKLQLIY